MDRRRIRAPLIGLLIAVAVVLEIAGLGHAFRVHGKKDGTIALIVPPVAWYRAIESLRHRGALDAATMAESDRGRRSLSAEITLPDAEWRAVLADIESRPDHRLTFTMNEAGTAYAATALVVPGSGATLTIRGPQKDDADMTMTDSDRDQTPEWLTITKTVDGMREPNTFPLTAFQNGEESQFLLAWSIAWAQIARK